MGRNSQYNMTGFSYEHRVLRAKRRGIVNRVKSLLRLNKEKPTRYANVRRHGVAQINPTLVKQDG